MNSAWEALRLSLKAASSRPAFLSPEDMMVIESRYWITKARVSEPERFLCDLWYQENVEINLRIADEIEED